MNVFLSSEIIKNYFPEIPKQTFDKMSKLFELYNYWNQRINVISRKDIQNFYLHHVLHSLSIAKFFKFEKGQKILDLGTGGGFPGIPLAIFFPEAEFLLADSIKKKIIVVNEVVKNLQLNNVHTLCERAENIKGMKFDYITTRAVAPAVEIVNWTKKIIQMNPDRENSGYLFLKGGMNVEDEFKGLKGHVKIFSLEEIFREPYFKEKKLIHLTF